MRDIDPLRRCLTLAVILLAVLSLAPPALAGPRLNVEEAMRALQTRVVALGNSPIKWVATTACGGTRCISAPFPPDNFFGEDLPESVQRILLKKVVDNFTSSLYTKFVKSGTPNPNPGVTYYAAEDFVLFTTGGTSMWPTFYQGANPAKPEEVLVEMLKNIRKLEKFTVGIDCTGSTDNDSHPDHKSGGGSGSPCSVLNANVNSGFAADPESDVSPGVKMEQWEVKGSRGVRWAGSRAASSAI